MRFVFSLLLSCFTASSVACSALFMTDFVKPVIAVNLDWPNQKMGIIRINPRNQLMIANTKNNPLSWTRRFGNVVFYGNDIDTPGPAADGMNEKGLVAFVLALPTTEYPKLNDKPTLNTGLWLQYVLDNFQSVQEVIEHANDYQLQEENYDGLTLKLHLLIYDKDNHYAILEYINGSLIVYQDKDIPYNALTNGRYQESISTLSDYRAFDGSMPLPGEYDSAARFVRAAAYLKRISPHVSEDNKVAYAFNMLADVAQPVGSPRSTTQVSMVYDEAALTIYFRTLNAATIRTLSLNDIDFKRLDQVMELDTYRPLSGDVLGEFRQSPPKMR